MPIMDGIEATNQIRQHMYDRNIPQPIIIGCSGHCEDNYLEQGFKAGLNAISSKPIDIN